MNQKNWTSCRLIVGHEQNKKFVNENVMNDLQRNAMTKWASSSRIFWAQTALGSIRDGAEQTRTQVSTQKTQTPARFEAISNKGIKS